MEILRLFNRLRLNKAIKNFQLSTLYGLYQGKSLFTIFFFETKVLQFILDSLEKYDFVNSPEKDLDSEDIENQVLRRIYFLLSVHEIEKPKQFQRLLNSEKSMD